MNKKTAKKYIKDIPILVNYAVLFIGCLSVSKFITGDYHWGIYLWMLVVWRTERYMSIEKKSQ